MNTTPKKNMFDSFDTTAETSKGLATLDKTKITLTTEQRTKNCISVLTPTEHSKVRAYCRELDEKLGKRITLSDVGRELILIAMDEPTGNSEIREDLIAKLRKNI